MKQRKTEKTWKTWRTGAIALLCALVPSIAAAQPREFTEEVRALYSIVACPEGMAPPANVAPDVLEAHCAALRANIESYRTQYATDAKAFLDTLKPPNLPSTVVYPFGGGDLISALTTYPHAKEITTLSLEHAGDPRRVLKSAPKALAANLKDVRRRSTGLLRYNDSTSVNLSSLQRGDLPGQLVFFMFALAVHGYEPVGLRFFKLSRAGEPVYYTEEDITKMERSAAKNLKSNWTAPDFSPAFSNAELRFVKKGAKDEPPIIHRHIAANLQNSSMKGSPVLAHLKAKGQIVAMTKAASYLLWNDGFKIIRDYLLEHMVFMISDSTGVPPEFAAQAGFAQKTFGHFTKSFLGTYPKANKDFLALWRSQPERFLPFRYGYIDNSKRYHLLLTYKPGVADPPKSPDDGGSPMGESSPLDAKVKVSKVDSTAEALGGKLWRLITPQGPVLVWAPPGYDARKAGVVIYAHGYYTRVDRTWSEHALGKQFLASGRNALFIVPEASSGNDEQPFWPDLNKLLRWVSRLTKQPLPKGPRVVVAHSGGYRSALAWLAAGRLDEVVLLDGLYRSEELFLRWLKKGRRRLTLVSSTTVERADKLAEAVKGAVVLEDVPSTDAAKKLAQEHAKAKLVNIKTQQGHMEIIEAGSVIPAVLASSKLP